MSAGARTGSSDPVVDAGAERPGARDEPGGPVHRALTILELLGDPAGPPALGVVEIARQLGRDKSQVSRVLKLLADAGFVDRDSGSLRYRIGTRLFAIGARAVPQRLLAEADLVVEREAARLGERVEVCVRSGGYAMTISTAAPDSELRAVGWVGRTAPLACTAAGRALLFASDDVAVARLLVPTGLTATGPDAPRSLDEVLVRLAADRARGFALARHETDRGLVALAAPVHDAVGRVVAAVAAGGPASRMDTALDDAGAALVRAARDLSSSLGHEPGVHDEASAPEPVPSTTRAAGTGAGPRTPHSARGRAGTAGDLEPGSAG